MFFFRGVCSDVEVVLWNIALACSVHLVKEELVLVSMFAFPQRKNAEEGLVSFVSPPSRPSSVKVCGVMCVLGVQSSRPTTFL